MTISVEEVIQSDGKETRLFKRKQIAFSSKNIIAVHAYDKCVHDLFEAQAKRNPDSIAIAFDGQLITYRELNTRANQLARFLRRFGIGPNSPVGLCVQRIPEMIVGVLGILKAGAAYVPVDPTSSADRLAFILRDANIFVLLTQSYLLKAIPRHQGPRLALDSDWAVIAKEKKTNPVRGATLKNLAYVMYASGPGAQSRGVMISHRGLINYLSWGVEAFEVSKSHASAVDSSTPLDVAISRALVPLIAGRTVRLSRDSYESDLPGTH